MSSPPPKKHDFEELFSSSETLHVSLKRPASVVLTSAPPLSLFSLPDDDMDEPEDPEDIPSLNDLSVAELKGGDEEEDDSMGLIKKAVRARSRVPTELLKDQALTDDVKLLCSEYNAVVEEMREEIAHKDPLDVISKQERRKSALFEFSLSSLSNGILTADGTQTS